MNNPFSTLTKKEWLLWLCSLFIVLVSNILAANFDPLTLIAALVGVTSLVFAAKGNVWAQVLMIVFSILYGIISFRFRYWGEMITYLGMALPMAVWSAITWLRHPAESGDAVAIQKLNLRQFAGLLASCVVVTVLFYRILAALDTPNLAFSTLSVITSFLAAALTMLRSSYYALGYALYYEMLDMEHAVQTRDASAMCLGYSRDVMDIMTRLRKEWGMKYPGEEWD